MIIFHRIFGGWSFGFSRDEQYWNFSTSFTAVGGGLCRAWILTLHDNNRVENRRTTLCN